MKKYIKYILCISAVSTFYSCGKDSVNPAPIPDPEQTIAIKLGSDFAVARYNVVVVDPEVVVKNNNGVAPQYKWTIKVTGKDGSVKDSVIGDAKTLHFIAPKAKDYVVDFTVTSGKTVERASTKVKVSETGKTYNSRALSLIDYVPSPSYNMDNYDFSTKAEALEQFQADLIDGNEIYLGSFGGYVTVGFDHTVINAYGKRDFSIDMVDLNAVKCSPASIYVAYDANKNGIADEDEWYEIAGSEYYKSSTIKNYEMTYHKPDPGKAATAGTYDWQFDTTYLKWTDNKNGSGTITKTKNKRRGNYYPTWMGASYTLKGTKLSLPVKDVSDGTGLNWNVGTFDWGYAGIKNPSIDISWAVDKNGKKVHLPGIDFVKVYVSTFAELGSSDLLTSSFKEAEDLNFTAAK